MKVEVNASLVVHRPTLSADAGRQEEGKTLVRPQGQRDWNVGGGGGGGLRVSIIY